MKRLDFEKDWPVPESVLTELGRMTALWSSLESNVNLGVGLLLGYDEPFDYRSVIALAHANFKQRVDILSSLCERLATDYPNLSEYQSVLKKIDSASRGRNKFSHSAIFLDENDQMAITYASARGTLKTTVEPVRINDIKEVTAKIHEATCALHSLITGKPLPPMWERTDKS